MSVESANRETKQCQLPRIFLGERSGRGRNEADIEGSVQGPLISLTLSTNQASNTNGLVCSWFLRVEDCFLTELSHLLLPIGTMSMKPKRKPAKRLAAGIVL